MTKVHPKDKLKAACQHLGSGSRSQVDTATDLEAEFQHKSKQER